MNMIGLMLRHFIDTTEFDHLYWRGKFDDIPAGKLLTDYAEYCSDQIYCMVYDDENERNPHEHTSRNMFFSEEKAKQYYDKMLKKFNKSIKTYSSRLKSEIEEAYHNIETAKEQIGYCENILSD